MIIILYLIKVFHIIELNINLRGNLLKVIKRGIIDCLEVFENSILEEIVIPYIVSVIPIIKIMENIIDVYFTSVLVGIGGETSTICIDIHLGIFLVQVLPINHAGLYILNFIVVEENFLVEIISIDFKNDVDDRDSYVVEAVFVLDIGDQIVVMVVQKGCVDFNLEMVETKKANTVLSNKIDSVISGKDKNFINIFTVAVVENMVDL